MRFTNQVIEQLPPSQITFRLQERIEELETLLIIKEKALKKAPEGSLRVSKSHGVVQYYHKINDDGKNGRYLDSEHKEVAQKLAQKAYNIKLLPAIKKELALLQAALTQIQKNSQGGEIPLNVLEHINPACRTLITTATLTDEQYAAAWLSQKYKGKPFQPDSPELYTARGERVRSKSEVIIADTLNRLGVPYHYEYPLTLNIGGRSTTIRDSISRDASTSRATTSRDVLTSGRASNTRANTSRDIPPSRRAAHSASANTLTVHPDFLCLNLRTREEFIWEHFGLMDDPAYSTKAVQKLQTYNQNGIHPGQSLIISTESSALPLNTKHIENIIQTYLK